MSLSELRISSFRNISFLKFCPDERYNLITGQNGSGKTSLLEAIYLLSRGFSFKTRDTIPLIHNGENAFTVFGKTKNDERISIQKSINSPTIAKVDDRTCSGSSLLAMKLPSLVFHEDLFDFLDKGPSLRRALIDWGLFYEETDYSVLCKDYRQVLKQRNFLLSHGKSWDALLPWSELLHQLGEKIHTLREHYFLKLKKAFHHYQIHFLDETCDIVYERGWDKKDEGKSLIEVLEASFTRDLARQYTHYGPHQADLSFYYNEKPLKHYLSRGQKKMLLFALRLTQALLSERTCLFLMDDLASELDEANVQRLISFFPELKGQFFLTVRPHDLSLFDTLRSHHVILSVSEGSPEILERM